jgi:hypothetical protein
VGRKNAWGDTKGERGIKFEGGAWGGGGGGGRGDCTELAQDRDRWQALVGTVRDFQVP